MTGVRLPTEAKQGSRKDNLGVIVSVHRTASLQLVSKPFLNIPYLIHVSSSPTSCTLHSLRVPTQMSKTAKFTATPPPHSETAPTSCHDSRALAPTWHVRWLTRVRLCTFAGPYLSSVSSHFTNWNYTYVYYNYDNICQTWPGVTCNDAQQVVGWWVYTCGHVSLPRSSKTENAMHSIQSSWQVSISWASIKTDIKLCIHSETLVLFCS